MSGRPSNFQGDEQIPDRLRTDRPGNFQRNQKISDRFVPTARVIFSATNKSPIAFVMDSIAEVAEDA